MQSIVIFTRWILVAAMMLVAHHAKAEEFFPASIAKSVSAGTTISADTTVGGYPVYQGANQWRYFTSSVRDNSQFSTKTGSLRLLNPLGGEFFAQMDVTVNLGSSGRAYFTDSPCSGEHLFKVDNFRTAQEASWNDCLTVDPHVITLRDKQLTTILVKVVNTQSAGRGYFLYLYINPSKLGMGETFLSDWSKESLARNPDRSRFIERVSTMGKQLQDAVKQAIGFGKPKDAFKNVMSFLDLHPDAVNQKSQPLPNVPQTTAPIQDTLRQRGIEERLSTLKSLFDKGLIGKDEYDQKRKEILSTFWA